MRTPHVSFIQCVQFNNHPDSRKVELAVHTNQLNMLKTRAVFFCVGVDSIGVVGSVIELNRQLQQHKAGGKLSSCRVDDRWHLKPRRKLSQQTNQPVPSTHNIQRMATNQCTRTEEGAQLP